MLLLGALPASSSSHPDAAGSKRTIGYSATTNNACTAGVREFLQNSVKNKMPPSEYVYEQLKIERREECSKCLARPIVLATPTLPPARIVSPLGRTGSPCMPVCCLAVSTNHCATARTRQRACQRSTLRGML